MSHATVAVPSFAEVPKGRIALWWVIASEIVIFGGLIACYLLYRIRFPEWAEHSAHTSTPLGALNTLILLSSSFTVVLAHDAAQRGNGKRAGNLLALTLLGGVGFLVVKGIEYTHEIQAGLTIGSHTFWAFYYTMTGLHAGHVVAGMVVMAIVRQGAIKGKNLHRVELAGLYWHFVDMVWIFLFPLLYIAK